MGWTFYDSSGRKLNTASTLIDNLDIDGATDIGAAIVDADLFIIDDGAGGTNRKTAASRLKTYIGSAASQAEMEAASSNTVFATPGRTQYHPSVAKVWCHLTGTGTAAVLESFNVSGHTDSGTGDYVIAFDTDFASAGYAFVMGSVDGVVSNVRSILHGGGSGAVGSANVLHTTDDASSGVPVSSDATRVMIAAFGDQA